MPTVLHAITANHAASEALRCGDERARFGALGERSTTVALEIQARYAVAPGSRIGLLMAPGTGFVSALLAVWRLRAAVLVLSTLHPVKERARLLDDADAHLLVTSPDLEAEARACAGGRAVLVMHPDHAGGQPDGATPTTGALSTGSDAVLTTEPDDLALLVYTSGTTSRPKGVMLSHRALAAQCHAIAEAWRLGPDDTLVHALPLHHVHGLVIALLSTLAAGGRAILLPRFDPAAVVAAAAEGTVFMGVPTMYARLVEHLEGASGEARSHAASALRRLRLCTSGSAALPTTIGRRWSALVGRYPVERFGMTELGVALSNRVDAAAVPGSVGWPVPGVRVRVLDEHDALADEGELQVSGPTLCTGYWRRPDAEADAFTVDASGERWFRTGDTVRIAEDGCVTVLGRTSVDILKSAGYKLSAPAIEEAIRGHPLVHDVAVVGLPDETYGQVVAAAVVTRPGATLGLDALERFLADELAPYQRPRVVRFVDDLPRNALGKVVKPVLAAALADHGAQGRTSSRTDEVGARRGGTRRRPS